MPRPAIGCGTNASAGLHVRTGTPMVKECQQGVMEFLLINHPLDCPILRPGRRQCMLQEQATGYGQRLLPAMSSDKNVKPKRDPARASRHAWTTSAASFVPAASAFCTEVVRTMSWDFRPGEPSTPGPAIPDADGEVTHSLNTARHLARWGP